MQEQDERFITLPLCIYALSCILNFLILPIVDIQPTSKTMTVVRFLSRPYDG